MTSPWITLATRKAYGGTWRAVTTAPFETFIAQWLDQRGYGYCMTEHTPVERICKFAWKSAKHQKDGSAHLAAANPKSLGFGY